MTVMTIMTVFKSGKKIVVDFIQARSDNKAKQRFIANLSKKR
jgi:ribosomal protein L28